MGLPELTSINDEGELQKMLDNTSDFDERKAIRQRIREVKDVIKKEMDERLKKTETAREEMLKYRHAQANESKERYLAMYNDAAKSGAAGGEKRWNTEAYKRAEALTATPRPAGEGAKLTASSKAAPTAKSARAAFQAADAQNNPQNQGLAAPAAKPVSRSPTAIKDMLLNWAAKMTEGYPNVSVTNFSSSWSNGLAFCALVHKFFPDAFDFNSLNPNNRKQNFELAFKKAEELADVSPLLDVDDMIMMKDKPDWKCVFCYVQALYRGLHQLTPPS
ncbi:smoothelin-like [Paramacrobiotus metropolitanus]|uniref:smoothelin-like n=1 Tax=Paramacrobiotus metropolitanus TaxID=2943436 RepID=UPI002445BD6E|nr:smoothelin-like [Paramacrobiotus metropolitanus]